MPKSELVDQALLLLVAVALVVGLLWLILFQQHRGISDRVGFFIIYNIGTLLVVTWQGMGMFRRAPGFWMFHGCWVMVHVLACGLWCLSGWRLELCVVTLPLEGLFVLSPCEGSSPAKRGR